MASDNASSSSNLPDNQVKENVTFKHYDPADIFNDLAKDTAMKFKDNSELLKEYVICRIRTDEAYERNVGAVQLFTVNERGVNVPYTVYGKTFIKNAISYKISNYNSYGHTERLLMRDVLNDLISEDGKFDEKLKFKMAKTYGNSDNDKDLEEDLRKLTEKAEQYRQYLEEKNIIVKMWSERPACTDSGYYSNGGDCRSFMNKICPQGSHYGYMVGDYVPLEDYKIGVPKVKIALAKVVYHLIQYKTSESYRRYYNTPPFVTDEGTQTNIEDGETEESNSGAVPVSVNKPDNEEAIQEEPSPKKSRLEN